jgi:hypothetical protein
MERSWQRRLRMAQMVGAERGVRARGDTMTLRSSSPALFLAVSLFVAVPMVQSAYTPAASAESIPLKTMQARRQRVYDAAIKLRALGGQRPPEEADVAEVSRWEKQSRLVNPFVDRLLNFTKKYDALLAKMRAGTSVSSSEAESLQNEVLMAAQRLGNMMSDFHFSSAAGKARHDAVTMNINGLQG